MSPQTYSVDSTAALQTQGQALLANLPEEVVARDYGCGDPSPHVLRGETVLDLGSSYGVNGALMKYALGYDALRDRYTAPSLQGLSSEDLLELDAFTRLLFAGLWCLADKAGRLEDRPKRIKIELLPADNVDIDAMLDALADKGFVQRYEVAGSRYLQITNFEKHQKVHPREAEDRTGV